MLIRAALEKTGIKLLQAYFIRIIDKKYIR